MDDTLTVGRTRMTLPIDERMPSDLVRDAEEPMVLALNLGGVDGVRALRTRGEYRGEAYGYAFILHADGRVTYARTVQTPTDAMREDVSAIARAVERETPPLYVGRRDAHVPARTLPRGTVTPLPGRNHGGRDVDGRTPRDVIARRGLAIGGAHAFDGRPPHECPRERTSRVARHACTHNECHYIVEHVDDGYGGTRERVVQLHVPTCTRTHA